jgi:hypothetical protein
MSDENDLSGAPKRPEEMMMTMERPAEMTLSLRAVRPNIVQSIRAFRVNDLQDAVNAASASTSCTRTWAMPRASRTCSTCSPSSSSCPAHFGKNFDALYDCMTDPVA